MPSWLDHDGIRHESDSDEIEFVIRELDEEEQQGAIEFYGTGYHELTIATGASDAGHPVLSILDADLFGLGDIKDLDGAHIVCDVSNHNDDEPIRGRLWIRQGSLVGMSVVALAQDYTLYIDTISLRFKKRGGDDWRVAFQVSAEGRDISGEVVTPLRYETE